MKTYNHIDYRQCTYFNVGIPNQWHEQGFLVYEGMIYRYSDDRHDNYYQVDWKMTPEEFSVYARNHELEIPSGFL